MSQPSGPQWPRPSSEESAQPAAPTPEQPGVEASDSGGPVWPGAMRPSGADAAGAPPPAPARDTTGTGTPESLAAGVAGTAASGPPDPPPHNGAIDSSVDPGAEPEPERPPILGRPASPFGDGGAGPEVTRSTRSMVLTVALIAVAGLAVCNGVLIWVYLYSNLSVVVTLGIFLTVLALTALRNRGPQLTAIVFYAQFLLALSAIVGYFAGRSGGSLTVGILTGGITFTGLALLSAMTFWFLTGEKTSQSRMLFAGTSIAIMAAMVGSYAFLSWDHSRAVERERAADVYVIPADESVDKLVTDGQAYTGRPDYDPPHVSQAFEDHTCEGARKEIAALFEELRHDGREQINLDPETLKVLDTGVTDGMHTATVSADVSIVRAYTEEHVDGPFTWTFHLQRMDSERYWKVCEIDRGE